MKLFRVVGEELIHKSVPLPPIINQYICATGREGPACDADLGFVCMVEKFDGKKEDITCQKCRSLA